MLRRALRVCLGPARRVHTSSSQASGQTPEKVADHDDPTGPRIITPALITDNPNEFSPSKRVREFAAKHQMIFTKQLHNVRPLNRKFPVRFAVSPQHAFSPYHQKYLNTFEHALTDKTLYHYEQKKSRFPLWLYVHSTTQDGSIATVRFTSERVAMEALYSALYAAGFDKIGRCRSPIGQNLYGTIRVSVLAPKALLKLDFRALVEYFKQSLASDVLSRLGRSSKPPSQASEPFVRGRY